MKKIIKYLAVAVLFALNIVVFQEIKCEVLAIEIKNKIEEEGSVYPLQEPVILFKIKPEYECQNILDYSKKSREFDTYIAIEEEKRAEEERIKEEKRKQEELARKARERKTVDFDSYLLFTEVGNDAVEAQYWVDQGYITKYAGDYDHHNEGKFLELFLSINVGDTVKIGGKEWKAEGFEYGTVSDDLSMIIGDNTGNNYHNNGTTEIVTCYGGLGTIRRQIWRLIPIGQ